MNARPLALVALLLSACATLPTPTAHAPAAANPVTAYVIRRSWHTDVGFDSAALGAPLTQVRGALPDAQVLLFGFGDQQYLLNRNQRSNAGMVRAVWPGSGLVLMTGLTAAPESAFGSDQVVRVTLTAAQAQRLQDFIWMTLNRSDSAVAPLAPGPYAASVFYAATLRYSGVHTCNTWTVEALKAAGLPVHTAGVEFAGQVWHQVMRISRSQAADPHR